MVAMIKATKRNTTMAEAGFKKGFEDKVSHLREMIVVGIVVVKG